MNGIYDSLNNVYALTNQINALRKSSSEASPGNSSVDPQAVIYQMQSNFNQMLMGLISSSNSEEEKKNSDPLADFINYQNSLLNYQMSQNQKALKVNPYTGSVEVSEENQTTAPLVPYQLNLDNIF
jgi:hypothetical protein